MTTGTSVGGSLLMSSFFFKYLTVLHDKSAAPSLVWWMLFLLTRPDSPQQRLPIIQPTDLLGRHPGNKNVKRCKICYGLRKATLSMSNLVTSDDPRRASFTLRWFIICLNLRLSSAISFKHPSASPPWANVLVWEHISKLLFVEVQSLVRGLLW